MENLDKRLCANVEFDGSVLTFPIDRIAFKSRFNNLEQLNNTIEMLIDDDENIGKEIKITTCFMTEEELDELDEFEGF